MNRFILDNSKNLNQDDKKAILKIIVDMSPIAIMNSNKKDTDINLDVCNEQAIKLIHHIVKVRMDFLNRPSDI